MRGVSIQWHFSLQKVSRSANQFCIHSSRKRDIPHSRVHHRERHSCMVHLPPNLTDGHSKFADSRHIACPPVRRNTKPRDPGSALCPRSTPHT